MGFTSAAAVVCGQVKHYSLSLMKTSLFQESAVVHEVARSFMGVGVEADFASAIFESVFHSILVDKTMTSARFNFI
jgi:hypothetical protein